MRLLGVDFLFLDFFIFEKATFSAQAAAHSSKVRRLFLPKLKRRDAQMKEHREACGKSRASLLRVAVQLGMEMDVLNLLFHTLSQYPKGPLQEGKRELVRSKSSLS